MKQLTTLFLALAPLLPALGQKDIPAYGEVSKEDLAMTTCDLDPEADAYILIKTGETDFNLYGQGYLQTDFRFRIKVLKDRGIERANIVIPYYAGDGFENIEQVSGETYNLDDAGNILTSKLEKSGIYTKALNKNFSEIAFTLPDVKKGSIIEYKFTKVSRNFTNIDAWSFQDDIPTRFSRYTLSVPSYFDFTYTIHKRLPIDVTDDGGFRQAAKTFTMRNIPGLKDEPFMSARQDYLQHIDFQISAIRYPGQAERVFRSTWEKLNEEMLQSDVFGSQLHRNIPHTDSLEAMLKGLRDSTARMAAVFAYVRRNMEWDHVHSWHSQSVREAWEKRNGSTGDINLILVDLLKDAGLKAYPLLVSTRSHGAVNPAYPLLAQFNEVMAYVRVGGHAYVLNGAERYTPYTLIPYDVRSSEGFIVDSRASGWVTLLDNESSFKNTVVLNGDIDARGHLRADVTVLSYDYSKINRRRRLDEGLDRLKETYFVKPYANLSVDSLRVSDQDNDSLPMEQDMKCFVALQHSGDYWFLTPNLFLGLEKNPFVQDRRFSDVDFGYTQSYMIVGSVNIPDGFQLETLPKNIRMITQDTSIVLERVMQAADGQLRYRITVDFKRPVYFADEYDAFKEFYKRLFATLNEQVILRKKS
jgi:hypothetical protein